MSTAILFPGQGSQSQGMLSELYGQFPQMRHYFEEASDVLALNLWDIVCNNPKGQLNATAITQPILLTAGMACFDILMHESEIRPSFMAGHSLGEYTALCASGALSFADAVRLVHHRGQLMQEAVPYGEGAMAAILGLKDEEVSELCKQVDGVVEAANFNAPGQVVIAGSTAAVQEAVKLAKAQGAKRCLELPVSVPSHCSLMKAASAKLSLYLDKIEWHLPKTPVIHNVDAQVRHNIDGIKSALGAQLYQPVRWVSCIHSLQQEGVDFCIEAAPGKVLTGLNKRIDRQLDTIAFDTPAALSQIQTRGIS